MDVNGAGAAKNRTLVGHLIFVYVCVVVCVCVRVRVHENEWGGGAVTKRISSETKTEDTVLCF